ncbi:MAG: tetratricopeptide repeat protein, partial [Methanothrix sp.]|uniref:tetratricopeptide repeat protein n=1 Tax=Methanothrix sp. TaxID=90426 RepID=UPI003BB5CA2C
RHNESIKAFEEAIRLDPGDAESWGNIGNVLAGLGRFDEALEAYDRALQIDPDLAGVWYNRGVLLKALKEARG